MEAAQIILYLIGISIAILATIRGVPNAVLIGKQPTPYTSNNVTEGFQFLWTNYVIFLPTITIVVLLSPVYSSFSNVHYSGLSVELGKLVCNCVYCFC
ncbi:hypothetical protein BC833DRAFT_596519 [Globomyces pollinis-pini]|nr:hypothetical protein BC833DRAFT_596519 [Globomyces pollinis-pini]